MLTKRKNNMEMSIPIKININNICESQIIYDDFITIIFVLEGNIKVKLDNKVNIMNEEEILIINRFSNALMSTEHMGVVLMLQIDPVYFDKVYKGFSNIRFKSSLGNNFDYQLKRLIAKMVSILDEANEDYRIKIEKNLLELSILLLDNYVDDNLNENKINDEHLKKILSFIKMNHKEKISLDEIAEHVHLNSQYLSRFFSKTMNTTIVEYITRERLNTSMDLLRYTSDNISDIALESGFPNIKSYFKAFKKYYDKTPAQYRKSYNDRLLNYEQSSNWKNNYNLKKLYKYNTEEAYIKTSYDKNVEEYSVDINNTIEDIKPTWKKIIAFSKASDAMGAEMRNQLRQVQKDIGFEYARFHGIFSDDMRVYNEDENGDVYYDFSYADQLIDFLLEIGLKPFIELSFMPDKLAAKKEYVFAWHANMSLPKDINKWCDLVRHFIKHLIERFGKNEVLTWYFEIWNGPDFYNKLATTLINERLEFFTSTYKAIKDVNKRLKIGGVNTYGNILIEDDCKLLKIYFKHLKKNNIKLDFISFSIYPIEIPDVQSRTKHSISREAKEGFFLPQNILELSTYAEKDFTSLTLDKIRTCIKENTRYEGEIFVNEWNLTPDPRDKINDTLFKATFFLDNVISNFNKVDAFIYWTFSDIFDELKYKSELFDGGIGFVSTNGLKKPIYYVYNFLNRLGDKIIFRGKGFIVTKGDNESIQIIIYNYCDFKDGCRDISYENKYNRYSIFNEKYRYINLIINGLYGKYIVNTYRLNKDNGSVFDTWKTIGSPKNMGKEILSYLANKSIYKFYTETVTIKEKLKISEKLEPHEIILIDIKV